MDRRAGFGANGPLRRAAENGRSPCGWCRRSLNRRTCAPCVLHPRGAAARGSRLLDAADLALPALEMASQGGAVRRIGMGLGFWRRARRQRAQRRVRPRTAPRAPARSLVRCDARPGIRPRAMMSRKDARSSQSSKAISRRPRSGARRPRPADRVVRPFGGRRSQWRASTAESFSCIIGMLSAAKFRLITRVTFCARSGGIVSRITPSIRGEATSVRVSNSPA